MINSAEAQKVVEMNKTKAVKKAVKKQAVKKTKAVKKLKIARSSNTERETVKYIFDVKAKTITAIAHVKNSDTQQMSEHKAVISVADIKELKLRATDRKRFYSYCNVELQLLKKLSCEAQAKKQHACTNTQYDSRLKLLALILQLSLSKAQQKAKAIKTVKKSAGKAVTKK